MHEAAVRWLLAQAWAMEPRALWAIWEGLRGPLTPTLSPTGAREKSGGDGGCAAGDSLSQAGAPAPHSASSREAMTRVGRSAVVRLKGPLLKADSWMVDWFGGTSMERARVAVLSAAADSSVDAIILDVDSPGGTVDGTDDLAAAVAAAAKSKAVIAQVGGMAASAAYWVASQATEIRMQRLDMVGSIGVRLLMYDFSKLFESEGIRPVLIDTGVHKSTGAMGVPISEEQEAEQRRVVERFYGEFLGAVQRGRGMTAAALKPYADGRLFFADEAVTAGLADKVVPRDATLGEAARSAETAARLRRARAVGI